MRLKILLVIVWILTTSVARAVEPPELICHHGEVQGNSKALLSDRRWRETLHEPIWDLDQEVNIQLRGLNGEEAYSASEVEDYLSVSIAETNPRLKFKFVEHVGEETDGGIRFYFHRDGTAESPFGTRKTWGYRYVQIGPYTAVEKYLIMSIHINLDVMDLYPGVNNRNAYLNVAMHEFLHAIGVGHIPLPPGHSKYPKPLMYFALSTDKLYYGFADKRAVYELYGNKGKRLTFSESEVGKTLYIIYKSKKKKKWSFSVPITDTTIWVEGIRKGDKKFIVD